MRYLELLERRDKNVNLAAIISAARKAKANLSSNASYAIDAWQSTNWDSGALEIAYQQDNEMSREINQAFEPVREIIRSVCGDTITLYRGQRKFEQHELTANRVLFSWTGDERVAAHFLYAHKPYQDITDSEISMAVQKYQQTGFCKFAGYSFKRSIKNAGFYEQYKGMEFIGDGYEEEMLDDFKERQSDRRESNMSQKPKGDLVTSQVSVDLIVWVTNDLNSKEFIVRLNPLK